MTQPDIKKLIDDYRVATLKLVGTRTTDRTTEYYEARAALEQAFAEQSALIKKIRDAERKWRENTGGIGLACFLTAADQEQAFAKADSKFARELQAMSRSAPPSTNSEGEP